MKNKVKGLINYINNHKKLLTGICSFCILLGIVIMSYFANSIADKKSFNTKDLIIFSLGLLSVILSCAKLIKTYYPKNFSPLENLDFDFNEKLKKYKGIETDKSNTYSIWENEIAEIKATDTLYVFLSRRYRFNKDWNDTVKTLMLPGLLPIVTCFAKLNSLSNSYSVTPEQIDTSNIQEAINQIVNSDIQSVVFEIILSFVVIFISIYEIAKCESENDFIFDAYNIIFKDDPRTLE